MTDLRKFFDRVFVVNLDRRPDRWHAFEEQARQQGFTGYERMPAVDGRQADIPSWFTANDGAWGCFLSHLFIAEEALAQGLKSYLVFEDDVVFQPGFTAILEKALTALDGVKWDQLYFGGLHNGGLPQPFLDGIVRCDSINRTHAYAVNGPFVGNFSAHIREVDRYSGGKHFDKVLGELHAQRWPVILAADPWPCGQAGGFSDILGVKVKECYWHKVRGALDLARGPQLSHAAT